MRLGLFGLFAFIALILQMTLMDLVSIGGARPSLLAILGLFVALWAPRHLTLWCCFALGLLIDLTTPIVFEKFGSQYLIGPYALGMSFAAVMMLNLRTMVMRRQVFAFSILAFVFAVSVSIVVVAVFMVRSWFPEHSPEFTGFSASGELVSHLAAGVYTAIVAVPLGWLLLKTSGMWHFQTATTPAGHWR